LTVSGFVAHFFFRISTGSADFAGGQGIVRPPILTAYKAFLLAPGAPERRKAVVGSPNAKDAPPLIDMGLSFRSTQGTRDIERPELPPYELFHNSEVEPCLHGAAA
jgi:hypothetical protein